MCAYCFLNYLDSYVNILFVQGCASESSLYFFPIYLFIFIFGCAGSSLLHAGFL